MTTAPVATRPPKIASLYLHNARSWRGRTHIGLHPGVNVFVGQSDAGKSNIPRNIRSAVFNDAFDTLAHNQESSCSVAIEFEDGTHVLLEKSNPAKGKGMNQYCVKLPGAQAVVLTSVGSGVPDQARAATGLSPITLAGQEVDIHFSTQRGPAFLVDSSPAVVASVVGGVSGIDTVFAAVKSAEDQRRDAASASKAARQAFDVALADFRAARGAADLRGAREAHAAAVNLLVQARGIAAEAAQIKAASAKYAAASDRSMGVGSRVTDAKNAMAKFADHWKQIAPLLNQARAIDDHAASLRHRMNTHATKKKLLADLKAALPAIEAELDAFVAKHKACPLCGQAMNRTHAHV